jgi:hypothetical protein
VSRRLWLLSLRGILCWQGEGTLWIVHKCWCGWTGCGHAMQDLVLLILANLSCDIITDSTDTEKQSIRWAIVNSDIPGILYEMANTLSSKGLRNMIVIIRNISLAGTISRQSHLTIVSASCWRGCRGERDHPISRWFPIWDEYVIHRFWKNLWQPRS